MNIQSIQSTQINRSNMAFSGNPMVLSSLDMSSGRAVEHIKLMHLHLSPPLIKNSGIEVGIAPNDMALEAVKKALSSLNTIISIGVKNAALELENGFKVFGQNTQKMFKNAGADFTFIGHSDQRIYVGESEELINQKVLSALKNDLKPVLCVGESSAHRESDYAYKIISNQVKMALEGVSPDDVKKVVIVYQPSPAISVTKSLESDEAQRVCKMIRKNIADKYGEQNAKDVSILYGGNINESNAEEFFAKKDIDGGFVENLCEDLEKFSQVVRSLVKQKC